MPRGPSLARRRSAVARLTAAVFLGFLLVLVAAGEALAEPLRYVAAKVDDVKPTQAEIGLAAVDAKVDEWRLEAQRAKLPLRDWAERVLLPRMGETVIEGIVDPRGEVRITDGHHRTTALRRLAKETGLPFRIKVAVVADYTGKSDEEYASHFVGVLKKGWFLPDARNLSPVKRLASIPDDFESLHDNPMRSAVDAAMERSGVAASDMVDYIQFYAGEALVKRGLIRALRDRGRLPRSATSLPSERCLDPGILDVLGERLFTDAETVGFLRARAKPGREHALDAALAKAEVRVSVDFLGPTQEVHLGEALAKLTELKAHAAKSGLPFRDYVTRLAAEQGAEKPIEAVVDVRGTIRVLAKHQRLAALARAAKEAGVDLPVKVVVVRNFAGSDEATYAKELGHLQGQRASGAVPAARVALLPRSFDAVLSPLASPAFGVRDALQLPEPSKARKPEAPRATPRVAPPAPRPMAPRAPSARR
jgi:hypothetical protein